METIVKSPKYIGSVMACRFQRKQNGEWERGVCLNETHIVAMDGTIPEVWDSKTTPLDGAFHLFDYPPNGTNDFPSSSNFADMKSKNNKYLNDFH